MAVTLEITDGTTTADFTTSTAFQLLRYWEPVVATPAGDGSIPGYVTDVLPVIIRATSDNNFAATMQGLHSLQRRAAEYWADRTQITPVWFHRQLTAESSELRTLVRSISFDPDAHFGSWIDACPPITDGRIARIAITHHPYWEKTSATSAAGSTGISVLGGAADHTTTDVVGDVPARLYALRLYGAGAGDLFRKYWIGFRSENKVDGPQNFTALWELEDGSGNGTDCAATTDATASPGGGGNTKMQCDFSVDTGWAFRCSLSWDTITSGANRDDFAGTFLLLLRAKVDTGTAQVKVDCSFGGNLTRVFGPTVDIAATDYTIYNLGLVTFPVRDMRTVPTALVAQSYDGSQGLFLWARRKTGSTAALEWTATSPSRWMSISST